MSIIEGIIGRQVLDSRGNPTVEVEVVLDSGAVGRAIVPSGASTGAFEAVELRDGDDRVRRQGRAAPRSTTSNGEIADAILGLDALDQRDLDRRACSSSTAPTTRAASAPTPSSACPGGRPRRRRDELGLPLYRYVGGANAHVLPVPMMNVINGGEHADNNVDFQEFMLMPVGAASFSEALRWGVEMYHVLKRCCTTVACRTAVGDEGGFAPNLAVQRGGRAAPGRGHREGRSHARATRSPSPSTRRRREIFKDGRYVLAGEGRTLSPTEMADYWVDLVRPVPDRLHRGRHGRGGLGRLGRAHRPRSATASSSWATTCSSPTSSASPAGIDAGVANSILVKVNQIGTLTETLDAVGLATRSGYTAVMSHRSGETEDTTIADLAVATNCGQIKTGAPARSDRVAKYNQLLRIEEQLGNAAIYRGRRRPGTPREWMTVSWRARIPVLSTHAEHDASGSASSEGAVWSSSHRSAVPPAPRSHRTPRPSTQDTPRRVVLDGGGGRPADLAHPRPTEPAGADQRGRGHVGTGERRERTPRAAGEASGRAGRDPEHRPPRVRPGGRGGGVVHDPAAAHRRARASPGRGRSTSSGESVARASAGAG